MKILVGVIAKILDMKLVLSQKLLSNVIAGNYQYITGGNPNIVMVFPKDSFSYSSGNVATFSRKDLETPVTRHFCDKCGTAIGTSPSRPNQS